MSSTKVKGKEAEAGPAAAAAAPAEWYDDTDQRREKGQPYVQHLWELLKSLWGQDGPGGIAVKGKWWTNCTAKENK